MILEKITFEIPEQFVILRKVYKINIFDLVRWYSIFKNVTGRSSYVAFELDLKRFLSFFNPDSIDYWPIKNV